MQKLIVIFVFLSFSLNSQNEFEKYGPFGSQVYTDLKLALDININVYKMDLSYKKLEPKLFAKLGKLKDLQALILSGNEIKTYPTNFSDLYNLLYFATYNNEFTSFPPDFKKLVNLNYLEFFGAKLDSIPADIAYLNRLKTLKISSTNDTLYLPSTLKYLKNLKVPWRLKWISENDQGIYDAMNKGTTHASGDFVWYLNSGDYAADNQVVSDILKQLALNPDLDLLYAMVC